MLFVVLGSVLVGSADWRLRSAEPSKSSKWRHCATPWHHSANPAFILAQPLGAAGPHGGNLDLRELTEGSVLYLPVWQRGALIYTGDSHTASLR
jgi:acetamidase/formamidase